MRLINNVINHINNSKLLSKINLSKTLTDHIVGEHHTKAHRRIVGVVIIVVGVVISKVGGDFIVLHIACDAFGYALHGLGLIPFISDLEKH